MLWRKAWAESRTRFVVAGTLILTACVSLIVWGHPGRFYVFGGQHRTAFLLFAIILGMGGLVRERELGTSAFTLSLPVSRTKLVLVRAMTGLSEVVVIGFLPVGLITACALSGWQPYPLADAFRLAMQWLVGGSALFALAFLASAVLPGEYSSFVAAFVVFFGHTVTTQFIRLARPATRPYLYTVQEVMGGMRPSLAVPTAVTVGITICLIAAAAAWTNRRDF